METIILLVQCASLMLSFLTAFLILAALPYAFGLYVGMKEGQKKMIACALRDEQKFSIWLHGQRIRENQKAISRLSNGTA